MRDMDTSELLTFLTNSKGGLQAVARLCQAYALGGYEEGGLCPVVALSSAQYQHPNPFGKIWTPKFQITSWVPSTAPSRANSATRFGIFRHPNCRLLTPSHQGQEPSARRPMIVKS